MMASVIHMTIIYPGRRYGPRGKEDHMERIFGRRILRCSDGHLFTSSESSRLLRTIHLGPKRLMRCPVDRRWRLVGNVDAKELTEAEREEAAEHQA